MAGNDAASGPTAGGGGGGGVWGGGAAVLFGVIALVKLFGGGKADTPVPAPAGGPPAVTAPAGGPMPPPTGASVARLNISGRDGTAELIALTAGMTDAQALALGLGVVLTGTDTYAARVRVTNTGAVPVRVDPENLLVHFGTESAVVTTVDHPRFLRRGVLLPGYEIEGLVLYRARVDVGAAMRLAGGGLSYTDDAVRVTYDP